MFLIIPFIIYAITCVFADPFPTGGANCTNNADCGYGTCLLSTNCTNSELDDDEVGECFKCSCPDYAANPDCSYKRKDRMLAGVYNFYVLSVWVV